MAMTETSRVPGAQLRTADVIVGESEERKCERCHPADLYRDDRRWYEWALAVLWLHPYVCCTCKARGLMFGRSYAFNWRWRQVRIRIILRVAPTDSRRQLLTPQPGERGSNPAAGNGVLEFPNLSPERVPTLDVASPKYLQKEIADLGQHVSKAV